MKATKEAWSSNLELWTHFGIYLKSKIHLNYTYESVPTSQKKNSICFKKTIGSYCENQEWTHKHNVQEKFRCLSVTEGGTYMAKSL